MSFSFFILLPFFFSLCSSLFLLLVIKYVNKIIKLKQIKTKKNKKKPDPDVIRTRSLLIWSQTRYHCATESIYKKECPLMVKSVRVSSIFHIKESWKMKQLSKLTVKGVSSSFFFFFGWHGRVIPLLIRTFPDFSNPVSAIFFSSDFVQ